MLFHSVQLFAAMCKYLNQFLTVVKMFDVIWRCYQPKMSACVPVCRNRSVSSLSFCSHVMSQFGLIWHSHWPLWSPFNWCGLYTAGSVPVASRISIASVISFMSKPRFKQRRKSFLNREEILTVYAISKSHFLIKVLQ